MPWIFIWNLKRTLKSTDQVWTAYVTFTVKWAQSKCHFLVLWNPAFKIVQSLEDIGFKKLAISYFSSQAVFSLLIIHCSLEIRSRNEDLFPLRTAWRFAVYLGQKNCHSPLSNTFKLFASPENFSVKRHFKLGEPFSGHYLTKKNQKLSHTVQVDLMAVKSCYSTRDNILLKYV